MNDILIELADTKYKNGFKTLFNPFCAANIVLHTGEHKTKIVLSVGVWQYKNKTNGLQTTDKYRIDTAKQ